MNKTRIHWEWNGEHAERRFQAGVSLHSHTLHSKESLEFIYKLKRTVAPARWLLGLGERQYEKGHGVALDLTRGWWTPPLSPVDAHRLEEGQIEGLSLQPIVSLTDHDDIEAPMSLQAVNPELRVPVSVEWTVPYRQTFFHFGVHNLPAAQARSIMAQLAEYTAAPVESRLMELFAFLAQLRETLVVFNHCLWDEKGVGEALHRELAVELIARLGPSVHALEMNGLRPWRENRAVFALGEERGLPVVSGGDRHMMEPNANLNLTRARTFAEFADEVRTEKLSHVWVATCYRQPHATRIFHNVLDVFRTYPNHGLGWAKWTDRVFYQCEDGSPRSISDCWSGRTPAVIGFIDSAARTLSEPRMRPVWQALLPSRQEANF